MKPGCCDDDRMRENMYVKHTKQDQDPSRGSLNEQLLSTLRTARCWHKLFQGQNLSKNVRSATCV